MKEEYPSHDANFAPPQVNALMYQQEVMIYGQYPSQGAILAPIHFGGAILVSIQVGGETSPPIKATAKSLPPYRSGVKSFRLYKPRRNPCAYTGRGEKVALFQTIISPKRAGLAQHLPVHHHLTFIDNLFPTTTALRLRILVAYDLGGWGLQFHLLKIEQLFIRH